MQLHFLICWLLCSDALWDHIGTDRGQQMTHQPSVDISALWQSLWPVSTFWVITHTNRKHTCTEIQVKVPTVTACIWPSLMVWESACSSSHGFTRVCSLSRFNPSFILHWVNFSFLTELSRWMKMSKHCYNLDQSHCCNPEWAQADAYTDTSATQLRHMALCSLSSCLQVYSITLKQTVMVQKLLTYLKIIHKHN